MGDEQRRKSDDKIDEMFIMVREIHQRQEERTIPAIEKLEKVVFGNGKKGLCDELSDLKSDVLSHKTETRITINMLKGFVGIFATVMSLGIVLLEFVFKHK